MEEPPRPRADAPNLRDHSAFVFWVEDNLRANRLVELIEGIRRAFGEMGFDRTGLPDVWQCLDEALEIATRGAPRDALCLSDGVSRSTFDRASAHLEDITEGTGDESLGILAATFRQAIAAAGILLETSVPLKRMLRERAGASRGGHEAARQIREEHQHWQQLAIEIWETNPTLPTIAVARTIAHRLQPDLPRAAREKFANRIRRRLKRH